MLMMARAAGLFFFVFQVLVQFWFFVFGCQYQCTRLHGKTCLQNDPFCVNWGIQPYSLAHSLVAKIAQYHSNISFQILALSVWQSLAVEVL